MDSKWSCCRAHAADVHLSIISGNDQPNHQRHALINISYINSGLGLKPTESYHLTLRFSPAPQSIFEISIFKLPFSKWSRWPQSLSGAGPPITGGNTPGDELQLDFNLIFFLPLCFYENPSF